MVNFVNNVLSIFNIQLSRLSNMNTMPMALQRAKKRGFNPDLIVDIGAAKGEWSLFTKKKIWNNANYILFEPLPERKSYLEELVKIHSNFLFVSAAVGQSKSVVDFLVTDDLDGSGISTQPTASTIKVPLVTLDDELKGFNNKKILLKLDTHGYEVPILEGAKNILQYTELIIIECYGLEIAPKSLLFWEMCAYMNTLGFRVVEVIDIVKRAQDGIFWQCDILFEKVSQPYFQHKTYKY